MRRTIAKVGLFVLLGLLAHLAVVVLCAMLIDVQEVYGKPGTRPGKKSAWFFQVQQRSGAIRVSSELVSTKAAEFLFAGWPQQYQGLHDPLHALADVSWWSRVRDDSATIDEFEQVFDREDARGWPMQSFRCSFSANRIQIQRGNDPSFKFVELRDNSMIVTRTLSGRRLTLPLPGGRVVRGGLLLPMSDIDALGSETISVLPLTPVWPEFLINTAFYTLAAWLLIAWPRKLLRRDRNDRGECEACGYPIGESPVCTECGADLRKQAVAESN